MRLNQKRLKTYNFCKKEVNKNNEGASYVEYGAPFPFDADIYSAGGKVKAEMYGERLNYMMTMLCYPCDFKEGDGICFESSKPNYKVASIKKYPDQFYPHWECDLEKL